MTATPEDLARYLDGECHVFAVALHRLTGCGLHVLLDAGRPYWTDPLDPDNEIPSVVHVYADLGNRFADVRGVRGHDARWDGFEDAVDARHSENLRDEAGLAWLVGYWADPEDAACGGEAIDRPLIAYDEADVRAALDAVRRVFPDGPPRPAS